MPNFPEITDTSFQEKISKHKFTCVVFSSINCGYCQLAKKNLKDILTQVPKIDVYEYIVDKNSIYMEKYNITSVPVMIIFDNGNIVHRFFGVREKNDLYYQFKAFLPKDSLYNDLNN